MKDLEKEGSLSVASLAERYTVSHETVRRDLLHMEADGLLKRLHGGAVSLSYRLDLEIPFKLREKRLRDQKVQIGVEAARLIQDGETLIIDDSSTALQVARALRHDLRLTVLTNSFPVANDLITRNNIRTVFLGGELRRRSYSCVGPATLRMIREYHVDKLILGVEGLSVPEGLTDSFDIEVELKQAMIAAAAKTLIVADSSKLGKVFFARVAPIEVASIIVTDNAIDPEMRGSIERCGITVVAAEAGHEAREWEGG
jgi:DeoR/GlpR family transcriptional regulator of sugar metabolism